MSKFILIALISFNAFAFNIGFNQAWFHNDYAHQYLEKYDPVEVERIFSLAQEAGSKTLRLWFFEGAYLPMFEFEGDRPIKLKEQFIVNVIDMLKRAKEYGIKIYFTLWDAHSYLPGKTPPQLLKRFKKLMNEYEQKLFLHFIFVPFLERLKDAGVADAISKIDLVNEGDTLVNRQVYHEGWTSVKYLLCDYKEKVSRTLPNTKVTFSIRWQQGLPYPGNILMNNGPLECADYFDLHSYTDSGKIYGCGLFERIKSDKEMILGEFGQSWFNRSYDDELHIRNTKAYIKNAKRCGFTEALAWRLSDVRPGVNPEARYSFYAFGKPRPAFYEIKKSNKKKWYQILK